MEKIREASLKLYEDEDHNELRIKTGLYQFARVGLLLGQASEVDPFGRYGSNGFTGKTLKVPDSCTDSRVEVPVIRCGGVQWFPKA